MEPHGNSPLSLLRAETIKTKHYSAKSFTKNVFYVKEFLDMMKELQEKDIFEQLVYANKFDRNMVHSWTKSGYKKRQKLLKNANKINLDLMKRQHDIKTPTIEQMQNIQVMRNYKCLSEFHFDKNKAN
mmetsp:Transcript_11269/g.9971  ORF Transcript_11269/g.9971 Transcript_11269/m.9971 type:complete len:128 (+) Transcript_11269:322-705(+)